MWLSTLQLVDGELWGWLGMNDEEFMRPFMKNVLYFGIAKTFRHGITAMEFVFYILTIVILSYQINDWLQTVSARLNVKNVTKNALEM